MKKRIACVLCVFILLSCCVPALAAEPDTKYADALKTLGLFQGTDKGYELEKTLTREQGVVMIIRLLGAEKAALECKDAHPFTDFANYTWFAPYAAYAYSKGITKGVSATDFGYGSEMTEAMFLTMLLRVLGYTDANDGSGDFVWSDPFTLAAKLKIAEKPKDGSFTRETMTERCWNTLAAQFKGEARTLSQKLLADHVFTEEQLSKATTGLTGASGGTSSGSASSGSGSGGSSGSGSGSSGSSGSGSGSGGSSGSGSGIHEGSTPLKPNETPRIPML